jgi:diaminopimelate decarboxylase
MLAKLKGRPLRILLEPGRRLVGNAGVLLTRVEYLKPGEVKNFAIVDAAMNDLARPALVRLVARHRGRRSRLAQTATQPNGRSSVRFANRGIFSGAAANLALAAGDLLAILSAGAYSMAMSSNYNSRPRAAEVMVDGGAVHLVRRRETVAELYALEQRLP